MAPHRDAAAGTRVHTLPTGKCHQRSLWKGAAVLVAYSLREHLNLVRGSFTLLNRVPIFAGAFTITSFQTEIAGRACRHLRFVFVIPRVTFNALLQMFS